MGRISKIISNHRILKELLYYVILQVVATVLFCFRCISEDDIDKTKLWHNCKDSLFFVAFSFTGVLLCIFLDTLFGFHFNMRLTKSQFRLFPLLMIIIYDLSLLLLWGENKYYVHAALIIILSIVIVSIERIINAIGRWWDRL